MKKSEKWLVATRVLLLVVALFAALAVKGEDSKVTFLPWSQTPTVLQCGRTYTSADFDIIQSGSMSVSEDGSTIEFDNLTMLYEKGHVDTFVSGSLISITEKWFTIVLKGSNSLVTDCISTLNFDGYRLTVTGDGSLTTSSSHSDIYIKSGEVVLDHTTICCQGYYSMCCHEKYNLIVRNSKFEGNGIERFSGLVLVGCEIRIPLGGWFDKEVEGETQIRTKNGNYADHFIIAGPDEDISKELVVNGNFEGSDFSSFLYKYSDVVQEVTTSNIVEEAGNHCLKVTSQQHAENVWNSQLFIKIPEEESLSSGTIVHFSMRGKASQNTTIKRSYFKPSDHYFDSMYGVVDLSTEWKTISGYYRGSYWYSAQSKGDVNAVILELNCDKEQAIDYYFDDISITIMNKEDADVSNISFSKQALLKNHTYSHEEFSEISSGSFSVSEDGTELIFNNLNIVSDNYTFEAEIPLKLLLKGENSVTTSKYSVVDVSDCQNLTIKGDGSLTTKSSWLDFYILGCNVKIDHTTLICRGEAAFGNNMSPTDKIIVNHSTFKGNSFFRIASLTLINSTFVSPEGVFFDPKDNDGSQLFTPDGNQVWEFQIQPDESDFNHRVSPWNFDNVLATKGVTKDVTFSMKNDGIEEVKDIAYVVSAGDIRTQEDVISLNEPYPQTGDDFNVTIPIKASNITGDKELTVTVTKVNGQENTSPRKSVKGLLRTISGEALKRVVVEEFTGTWCGWCTRGTLALDLLNREYGDNIITIAIHNSDPMEASSYTSGVPSYPSARVNRGEVIDPYYGYTDKPFGIKELVEEERSIIAPAGIELSAQWNKADMSAIKVDTKTTFLVDEDATNYDIGFALLEDGMRGAGSSWAQVNNYSGRMDSDDPNIQSITILPHMITDMEYNHVAVDAWSINQGIDGSVKDIQIDVPQSFSYICDIAANRLIQDKSKLSVIALLVDKRTGKICNAAKTAIAEYDPSGIEELKTADTNGPITVYTISGRKVNLPGKSLNLLPKGIYIVNSQKIVIK